MVSVKRKTADPTVYDMLKFACSVCQKEFATTGGLYKHRRREHPHLCGSIRKRTSDRKGRICGVCRKVFNFLAQLCKHMQEEHNIPTTISQYEFTNEMEFQKWKRQHEEENVCLYRAERCIKKNLEYSNPSSRYVCHLSYQWDAPEGSARQRKLLDFHCSAFISTKTGGSGRVKMQACLTHYGHDMVIKTIKKGRQPMNKEIIEEHSSRSEVGPNLRDKHRPESFGTARSKFNTKYGKPIYGRSKKNPGMLIPPKFVPEESSPSPTPSPEPPIDIDMNEVMEDQPCTSNSITIDKSRLSILTQQDLLKNTSNRSMHYLLPHPEKPNVRYLVNDGIPMSIQGTFDPSKQNINTRNSLPLELTLNRHGQNEAEFHDSQDGYSSGDDEELDQLEISKKLQKLVRRLKDGTELDYRLLKAVNRRVDDLTELIQEKWLPEKLPPKHQSNLPFNPVFEERKLQMERRKQIKKELHMLDKLTPFYY